MKNIINKFEINEQEVLFDDTELKNIEFELDNLKIERGFELKNPLYLNHTYILNGIITEIFDQVTYIIKVKEGDEITIIKNNISTSTLRCGLFNEYPTIGSSTTIYESTIKDTFIFTIIKDGFFAVSAYAIDQITFTMKSKRNKQVESNELAIKTLTDKINSCILTQYNTATLPNSVNLINIDNSIKGFYIGANGQFVESEKYSVAIIRMNSKNISVSHKGGFFLAATDEYMTITHVNEKSVQFDNENSELQYIDGDVYALISFKPSENYCAYYSNGYSISVPYNRYAEISKTKTAVNYGEQLIDINFLFQECELFSYDVEISRKVPDFYISADGSILSDTKIGIAIYMYRINVDSIFYVKGNISNTNDISCVILSDSSSTTGSKNIKDYAKGVDGEFTYFGKNDSTNNWLWVISDINYTPTVKILNRIKFLEKSKNMVLNIEEGVYLDHSGIISYNENYCITNYIPLNEDINNLICSVDGVSQIEGSGCIIAYDKNYNMVKSLGTLSENKGLVTWEDGISYVRFSIRNYGNYKVQVENATTPTTYIPPIYIKDDYIKKTNTNLNNPIIQIIDEIESGEFTESSEINYIRKNNIISFNIEVIDGDFDSITFGLGKTSYRGYWITVTNTQIIIKSETDSINEIIQHDVEFNSNINIIVDINNGKGTIRLQSLGTTKIYNITKWVGGGPLFIENDGVSTKKVNITLYSKDLKSDIWGYGDSYFSFNDINRWTYHLLDWGYDNILLDHMPGAVSETMINALNTDIKHGKPKYILWAMGMNDSADTTGVNNYWLTNIQKFISICIGLNIIPILSTIPSVPSKNHEFKNTWIRNSGYRYIDFAKAVGAQANGTWYEDMLSSDNVHPSKKGAIALASQALCDFPELIQ